MKLPLLLRLTAGFTLAALAAGCTTGVTPIAQTNSRIREKTEVFNKLTPRQQSNIMGGAIERGNTPDMVYMALGKPSKIVTSADGHKAMWVYVEYFVVNGPAITSLNNPNSPFLEGMTMVNRATGDNQNLPSAHPPSGHPNFMMEGSFAGTSNSGPTQSLDLPDLRSNTVYVFFYLGRVAEIKLDGDVDGQASALQPKPAKNGLNSRSERKV